MPALAVTKMHGTLNDFIIIDCRASARADLAALARRWCDRRGGIGADGLIVLEASATADARMRIINADGSEAEMCGNGMRCAVRYLCESGAGNRLRVETMAGIIDAEVLERGQTYRVRLNVGTPRFETRESSFKDADFVWVGNPHAVVFVPDADGMDLTVLAGRMCQINVHVAAVENERSLRVRHHERGVGLTHACGTGSVACAAAAIARGLARSPVEVHVPGGTLTVEWDGKGDAFLTGPAVRVFDASIDT